MAATAVAISADVRGNANRFVMMKYLGKLWKRIQASGAVKIWQDTAKAAACQMRRITGSTTLRDWIAVRLKRVRMRFTEETAEESAAGDLMWTGDGFVGEIVGLAEE